MGDARRHPRPRTSVDGCVSILHTHTITSTDLDAIDPIDRSIVFVDVLERIERIESRRSHRIGGRRCLDKVDGLTGGHSRK